MLNTHISSICHGSLCFASNLLKETQVSMTGSVICFMGFVMVSSCSIQIS